MSHLSQPVAGEQTQKATQSGPNVTFCVCSREKR